MTTTTRRTSKSPLPRIATRSALTVGDQPPLADPEFDALFTTPQVHSGDEPAETITMRGVLNFRFPAHASLAVRKQVVARFVREAQAKIDQEQQVERELAAFRESLPRGLMRRSSVTLEEAARQLGLSVAQVERAVSTGALFPGTVGYVKVISASEIERFRAAEEARSARSPANTKKPKRFPASASSASGV